MKITINTTKQITPQQTMESLRQVIVNKLNSMVQSSTNFFSWKDDDIFITKCSNVEMHNRVVLLLALFTDSNRNRYGTFTSFNSRREGISFCGYNALDMLEALEKFIDSIPNLNDVHIEIN